MAVDSRRGEEDLEIGLASPGSSGADISPRRRPLESCLSGKRLDQSSSPGIVMSSSGKRLDQAARRKKYVTKASGRHNDTDLHLAAQRGDLDAVRQIIAEIDAQMTSTGEEFDGEMVQIRAAVVNEANAVEETALLIAAERGFIDIVVELLKYSDKESLARKTRSGFSPLHVAAKEGHRDIVKVLLDHEPSLGKTFAYSNVTPLITAVIRGHLGVVNLLLDRVSGLVELSKTNGKNALHFAARQGHVEIVKALLESDHQLARKTDKKGQTALHMAVKGTSVAVVQALMNADPAMVMLPDGNGYLPVHVAIRKKRLELVPYIQGKSSYMEGSLIIGKTEDKQKRLPILHSIEGIDNTSLAFDDMQFQAYSQGMIEVIRLLETNKYHINKSPSRAVSRPGLVISSSENRLDQAAGRNKYGMKITGRHNDTELHVAAQRGDLDAVRQIISEVDAQMTDTGEYFDSVVVDIRAAVVNEPNNIEETALLIASERGFIDIVVELLQHSDKESLTRKNRLGFDALHVAAREGHRDIVKVLLDHDPSLGKTLARSNVTPLVTAAIRGHLEVLNLLLERVSGLVELSKADGKNALHFAARHGHVEIVKALLESDNQLARRTDKKGQTALHMAAKGTSSAVVKALVNADPAIVMLPDRSGNLPLHVATRKKRSELVLYIQEISSYMEGSLIIRKTEENQNIVPILYGIEGIDRTTLAFNDTQSQGYSQLQRDRAITARRELERMLFDESAEPKPLPLLLLEHITSGFSDDKKIGCGGFAIVYKGMLEYGPVAVKKLLKTAAIDDKKFTEEVRCLMKTKHKNIVRFLGYCSDTQEEMLNFEGKLVLAGVQQRLLCFEYLPKGSLEKQITDASCGLKWRKRYKIINGICDGLYYLHQMQIVHLDLKPENILLDDNMMPKIADFGLSRCFDDKQSRAIASKVFGTMGYMAPEFLCGRQITFKSDIYSLGIILIRILTGEKEYPCPSIDNVLDSWRNRFKKSEVDTQLLQVRVCTQIAIDCTDWNPEKRPDIQDIIARLAATKSVGDSATEIGTSGS